jgi:hypothetical protein
MPESKLTPAEKIEALTDLIADKQLRKGCLYEWGKGKHVMEFERTPEQYACRCRSITLSGQEFTSYHCGYCKKGFTHHNTSVPRYCRACAEKHQKCQNCTSHMKILGTPPDLSRVLWYVDRERYSEYVTETVWSWDFSKPLLRDQDEECINFLYDLLIQK